MAPAIVAALIAAGSQVAGNIFSSSANKKAQGVVDDQVSDLTAWRDTQVNQDPMESNVGQNVMRKALDLAKTKTKTIESSGAVLGSSAESQLAEKAGVQKGLSDTMSNVASYATAREDQIEGRYQSNLSQLLGQKTAMLQGKAQSGANVAGAAGDFIQGLAPMYAGNNAGNTAMGGLTKMQSIPRPAPNTLLPETLVGRREQWGSLTKMPGAGYPTSIPMPAPSTFFPENL